MPNLCFAGNCDWSTVYLTGSGYLYNSECHNQVGILVENEKDFEIEVDSLRKAISIKDLTIQDLKANSSMWEGEATEQFQRFEKYKKAESTRTWLYVGGGAAAALLLVYVAGQTQK
jgi:hypothetical protein